MSSEIAKATESVDTIGHICGFHFGCFCPLETVSSDFGVSFGGTLFVSHFLHRTVLTFNSGTLYALIPVPEREAQAESLKHCQDFCLSRVGDRDAFHGENLFI